MTHIVVRWEGGHITKVRVSGHTGFAPCGKDIVCAGLSAVAQTALLGLKQFGLRHDSALNEAKGILELGISPSDLSKKELETSDVILITMLAGLKEIAKDYPKHIILEEIQ